MTRLVRLNVVMYEMLLAIYPPDLRSEFGEAMAGAFSEQLEARTGAISAWGDVAVDLVRVALPYRLGEAFVPVMTLVGSSVLFYLVLMGVAPHGHW
jgi:hypothetical protein